MARNTTTISAKHQVTIPADAFAAAGLRVGDRLVVRAADSGAVTLERTTDPLRTYAGALVGVFDGAGVDDLREEWD
ncbi:MAG: AbrB family transcriptional regulator [Actinobacteria bacterium]|nr:MAG: AbrB family transcriptional regulator [Actinomycetota bacterium]